MSTWSVDLWETVGTERSALLVFSIPVVVYVVATIAVFVHGRMLNRSAALERQKAVQTLRNVARGNPPSEHLGACPTYGGTHVLDRLLPGRLRE
jgi:hypothetical protein